MNELLPVNSSHGQVVTQSSRHKPALYKAMGRGQKFSVHADIKDHYQRVSLKGDSRG